MHRCSDFIMGSMASQITSLAIVYLTVYSGEDQTKHQSSASLAGEFPAQMASKGDMFPFDDVTMPTRLPRELID